MRFIPDGPSLPDRLLNGRDQGQVIFFCGAGVSRARAKLQDFYGLAGDVVEALGSASDSSARKLISAAKLISDAMSISPITGVGGILPADRVFALLEQEFEVADVRAKVASALRPRPDADLSAHRMMLDLARGPDGQIRLVTTNFDLLFEAAEIGVKSSTPPNLPDPRRPKDFRGIFHLHGRVDETYTHAFDNEFVLSSADFGRAYLADGWATSFVRNLLDQYQLVFVGYTADDPPVQYLLEALSRDTASRGGLYAFQAGPEDQARALWAHKGVEAIAYDGADQHAALWRTLESWAERARDPQAWVDRIIAGTAAGPEALAPFQRGQLKHIVSSSHGALRFATKTPPPPAEWLCVFDPATRYLTPARRDDGVLVDPFDIYGLDDDPRPLPTDDDGLSPTREIPPNVWDGLASSRLDQLDLPDRHTGAIRGALSSEAPRLVSRLSHLGRWIADVANQPAAIWWAAGQTKLHPDLLATIQYKFQREVSSPPPAIEMAWRYATRAWTARHQEQTPDWFELQAEIKRLGWSNGRVRSWARVLRPKLNIRRPYSARPPLIMEDREIEKLVLINIEYSKPGRGFDIPDDYVALAVSELRRSLEIAVDLETEIRGREPSRLPSITPDLEGPGEVSGRDHGIAIPFLHYVDLLRRMHSNSVSALRKEISAWRCDDQVFSLLRIWAAGNIDTMTSRAAARTILRLDDKVFWGGHSQRDLLLTLKARWANLPSIERVKIESRLRNGPPRRNGEEESTYRQRRAYLVLERLSWLAAQGCAFSFDMEEAQATLRADAPAWTESAVPRAAESLEGRSGWVHTENDPSALLSVSPTALLNAVQQLSVRDHDLFTERRPLEGLAVARPVKILRALVLASKHDEYPQSAWHTFLKSSGRAEDRPRLMISISKRIMLIDAPRLLDLFPIIVDWMSMISMRLMMHAPIIFNQLWEAVMETARAHPEIGRPTIAHSLSFDWATSALNSPIGQLAQMLMRDDGRSPGDEGFPPMWLARVSELLALPGDMRRHALVFFVHNLGWFYHHAPTWAEKHLFSALGDDSADQQAFWSGFFWSTRPINRHLFMRLKESLFQLVRRSDEKNDHTEHLAGILLANWRSYGAPEGESSVSDGEMRNSLIFGNDVFRLEVLRYLEMWSRDSPDEWRSHKLRLFHSVWPRQRLAKSAPISERLAELALCAGDDLPAIVDAIEPFLVTIRQEAHISFGFNEAEMTAIVDSHPEPVLKLFFAILSRYATEWPYGVDRAVERLATIGAVKHDERLLQLRLRMAAR